MRKMLAVVEILFCLVTVLAGAQNVTGDAILETKKLLDAFRGTWSVTEIYDPSESMRHGGSGKGQEVWRAGPGERSVLEEYNSTTSTGFGLGWWEGESAGFRFVWCSNDDPQGCTRISGAARWEGKNFVLTHKGRDHNRDFELKEVFSDITPDSFTQTLYQGTPGKLRRFVTIKALRAK